MLAGCCGKWNELHLWHCWSISGQSETHLNVMWGLLSKPLGVICAIAASDCCFISYSCRGWVTNDTCSGADLQQQGKWEGPQSSVQKLQEDNSLLCFHSQKNSWGESYSYVCLWFLLELVIYSQHICLTFYSSVAFLVFHCFFSCVGGY